MTVVALAFGLAVLAGTTTARSEVAITPAADGQLGAWLLAGPLKKDLAWKLAESELRASADKSASGAPAFRVLAVRDGALDLDKSLGTGRKSGAAALLAGSLVLEAALDGWLLASVDGAFRVSVDGKALFERNSRSLRGSAVDAIPLRLDPGKHSVVLALEHPGAWWAVEVRLLDARDLLPPRGARLLLPGTTPEDERRLASDMLTVSLDAGVSAAALRPRLGLEYRRGAPIAAPLNVQARVLHAKRSVELALGQLPLGPRGVPPFEASLPKLDAEQEKSTGSLSVDVSVGSVKRTVSARVDAELLAVLRQAREARVRLGRHEPRSLDERSLSATLDFAMGAVVANEAGALGRLRSLLGTLSAGTDPLARPGVVSFARKSAVDGEPDPAVLHIPAGFEPGGTRRFPLVVLLHGLNGTAERIVEVFLDSKSTGPSVDAFVLAPYAHGNAFYRGPGEREVMDAVAWALATYPIDPTRVSLSGVSMGGTGTGHLGLRYADQFSAAAPLCGYHSFFVRRDTKGRPIRPWEHERMHHWSPASWAERGKNLPLWVAHGTRDFPLENSRVLVDRYRQLGYTITDEWPDTGHDVWTKAYAGARLVPWLTRARHDAAAPHIVVKTDQLRFGRIDWVTITELETSSHMGSLDVDATKPELVVVKTDGIVGFKLERGPRLPKTGKLELSIDGSKLELGVDQAVELSKRSGHWQLGADKPRAKRAGLEGPIRDVYLEPVVFSFGSGDPRTTLANREVAIALSRRYGPDVAYRVLPDTDLDQATVDSHAVFAVGSATDHVLLRRVATRLPIRFDAKGVQLGEQRFDAPGAGAAFVYPNPEAPSRYLVVVTGADASGIWRALSLPQLLPDFVVYDAALGPAAAEVILSGQARVSAAGFFDKDWKLPQSFADPEATKPR